MTEQAPEANGQAQAPEAQGQAPWYAVEGVTDELKGYVQNKGWDNPLKALTAYQNLEKYHGVPAEQIIKLPKDGEPMDAVYNRLGRPESADKYDIKLPEGSQVDDNRLNSFKDIAHKVGLSQTQVNALAEFDVGYMSQIMEASQTQKIEQQKVEETELRREWGNAFEERSELGRRAIRTFAPDGVDKGEFLSKIEDAIGTKMMLKMFSNIGERIGEAKIIDGSGDRPFGYTPEQAKSDRQSLMNEIKGDKTRLDNYNKGVGSDLEKMNRLNKIISGA